MALCAAALAAAGLFLLLRQQWQQSLQGAVA